MEKIYPKYLSKFNSFGHYQAVFFLFKKSTFENAGINEELHRRTQRPRLFTHRKHDCPVSVTNNILWSKHIEKQWLRHYAVHSLAIRTTVRFQLLPISILVVYILSVGHLQLAIITKQIVTVATVFTQTQSGRVRILIRSLICYELESGSVYI